MLKPGVEQSCFDAAWMDAAQLDIQPSIPLVTLTDVQDDSCYSY